MHKARFSRLKFAFRAARSGQPVLPLHWAEAGECSCVNPACNSVGKHPITAHGVRDATTDESTIRRWWNEFPKANIGVATGKVSDLIVVDVDPRHGGMESLQQFENENGRLPDGPVVRTGGGGFHLYFRYSSGIVGNKVGLLPGIDVRSDGGYVVYPGSIHSSGRRYRWLHGKSPRNVRTVPLPASLLKLTRARTSSTPLESESVIPEGRRNATLTSLLGSMHRRGMTAEALEAAAQVENRLRCDPPLAELEVKKIVRSVSSYRVGVPDFDSASLQEEVEKERKLLFRNAAEFVAATPPRIAWIARPWVAPGSITEVTGKIKAAGKTSWVTRLVRSVLDGKPFMGEPTQKTHVVYLSEERMTSFQEALRRADLRDRKDLFLLLSHEIYGRSWASVIHAAAEECKARRAGLLVVDTFAQFAGLAHDQENSAGAAFVAIKPLQEAAAQGLAILIVHHERKGGGQVSDAGRGSTAIGGAADVIISLRRPDGNPKRSVRLIQALSRFSETPSELLIELTADGYKSLGAPGVAARAQYAAEILAVLPHAKRDALTMEQLLKTTKKNRPHLQRMLDALLEEGKIERTGKGRKGHPFAYFAT